jgi:protein transport protein SEC24
MDNVTDMQMGALDCDKSMQIEIKYDDKLNDQERVFIQVATLFTSIGGQRRIQVHNIALPVTSNHTRMFEEVDQNVIFALMFKQGLFI